MYKKNPSTQNRVRRKIMRKRKLKKFVLPTLYLIILGVMACSITFLSKNLLNKSVNKDENYNYSMSVFNNEETSEEQAPTEEKIINPYDNESVSIAKNYYDTKGDKESQENALIYYANTYMPNTGILYESQEEFAILAVYNGKVKDIKEDEILGTVLTIENNEKLTTIYYSVKDVTVKVGDEVKTGDHIATSGTCKLETSKPNTLLFETYVNGTLTNPSNVLGKSMTELN